MNVYSSLIHDFYFFYVSGFDLESTNQTYLDGLKADIAYANSKGIEVGGYDLISLSRFLINLFFAVTYIL